MVSPELERVIAGGYLRDRNVAWCGNSILWSGSGGLTLVTCDTLVASRLHITNAAPDVLTAIRKSGKDSQIHTWPTWYNGEHLFLGGSSRALRAPAWISVPGKVTLPCATLCNVTGFYPTAGGLLAITLEGEVFLIKKK